MRIAFFTECYKPTINGVVTSIETFREELTRRGHEVWIVAPNHPKATFQTNVFRLPSVANPMLEDYPLALPFFPGLAEIGGRLQFDIIHTHHISAAGLLGMRLAHKLALPLVHTYHTMLTDYAHYLPIGERAARRLIIIAARLFCNRISEIVVPSTPLVEILRSYGISSPISVIPTGIDLRRFRRLDLAPAKSLLKKQGLLTRGRYAIYVGRLAREKNVDWLIRAFSRVAAKVPEAFLVLTGSGPDLELLRHQAARAKLTNRIIFTGFVDRSLIPPLLAEAACFVFPSTTDTQGIVVLEAMAAGTPPVAISVLGPTDFIDSGRTGYLTPFEIDRFAEKLELLLSRPRHAERLGQAARKASERFSIEQTTSALVDLYKKLLKAFHRELPPLVEQPRRRLPSHARRLPVRKIHLPKKRRAARRR